MAKRKLNYLIIVIFSLILVSVFMGKNTIFGSNVDWVNQYTVFPEFFRNNFYEIKKLIPNYIFNIGAGQNIFNFSYYGLMSPFVLISYFFPHINIETFISITSILLYLSLGILIYKFLISHFVSDEISLVISVLFQTLPAFTFHFHHHIIFVWYFPFLIMSLFGVDIYLKRKKSLLLIISTFLIILTNYYYSVPCILVIIIYGIYRLLEKYTNLKSFLIEIFKASLRIFLPILMTSFLLIPTAYSMVNMKRNTQGIINIKDFFIMHIEEIFYSSFGIDISFIFLISLFSIFCKNKAKKNEIFLNISLIILTLFPYIMYLLNGKLYIRGKVFIPLTILYVISLVKFIYNLIDNKINIKKLIFITIIPLLILLFLNEYSIYTIFLLIDAFITYLSLIIFNKYKKLGIIYIPLIILTFSISFYNNTFEEYTSDMENGDDVITLELLNKIKDKSFFRTDNIVDSNKNVNRVYNNNYYTTSIYTSTFNHYYNEFYNNFNNIEHRNMLNTSGANNYLFNKIMGVKYIISPRKGNDVYKKIDTIGNLSLYKNENVNPIIYYTSNYGSKNQYNKLKFPYNIEYLVNTPVTNSKKVTKNISQIKKVDLKLKKEYKFKLKDYKNIKYNLKEPIKDKILIITFDMNYNESCEVGDTSISINGVKNKLTCKEWSYHNQNNKFKYIITDKREIKRLNIYLSKGKYNISNINIYTMEYPKNNYKRLEYLNINKKNSSIIGKLNAINRSYVITSFPYDDNFKVYVDNKLVKSEIVNTAFLGFKIPKGMHTIKIEYNSKGYKLGVYISIISVIFTILLLFLENKKTLNNC